VLVEVLDWAAAHGWSVAGLVRSSLVGADGNVEYLVWLRRGGVSADLPMLIDTAL
jgi:predicted rRNA methylase YqxC with S4 and FtsJ domains